MVSVYDIKPRFQALLRPVVVFLARVGVTPNQVTVAALVLSFFGGACLYLFGESQDWPLLLLPCCLFVRMALNAIDGMLAREHQMESRLGAILNELGDVLSDAVLYMPLMVVPGFHPLLTASVVALALITEMTGVISVQIGSKRQYHGPMGKSDRALVFGALGLVFGLGVHAGEWLNVVLIAILLLEVHTIWRRARAAMQGSND